MFHTIFVYLDDGSGIGRIIQASCAGIMLLFVIPNIEYTFRKRFRSFNIAVLMFCISILISSFGIKSLNVGTGYDGSSYSLGIFYAITLIELVVFVQTIIITKRIDEVMNVLFKLFLFYCVITDLLMLGNVNFVEGYFIGNKFTVSYTHIICAVLYSIKDYPKVSTIKQSDSIISFFLLVYAFIISYLVDVSTGIVGCSLLFLLYLSRAYFSKILSKPLFILSLLAIFTIVSFLFQVLVNYSFVKYFIVEILGRDLTLTGRLRIYGLLGEILTIRPYTGFGLGNAHSILTYKHGIPNAQNGLLNVAIEQGVIGASALVVLIYVSISKMNNPFAYPMIALIVTYIVLASVEITLGMSFVYLLVILQIFKHNYIPKDFTLKYHKFNKR